MKKLMTMIAAVATAFGLYAADPTYLSGTSFEGTDGGALSNVAANLTELTGNGGWEMITSGEANVVDYLTSGVTKYSGDRPSQFASDDNDYFLNLKTGSEELTRYALGSSTKYDVAANGNYYFDSVVQLSAFDEDPSADITDAKLALWLLEDETAGTTNLMIKVGSGDAINLGNRPDLLGEWARVTIKALPISDTQIGFVLFIDTTAVVVDSTKTVVTSLNPIAQAYQKDGVLIVSGTDTEISNVGFKGTGYVDDIAFTQTVPGDWAADPAVYTIAWDDSKMANVMTNDAPVVGDSPVIVYGTAPASMNISWTGAGKWASGSETVDVGADGNFDLTEIDVAEAEATFNGVNWTLDDAKAKANAATEAGVLKLLGDVTNDISIANANAKTITLDLGGWKLTGAGTANATILGNNLVISNGTVDVQNNKAAVRAEAAGQVITIIDGTYEGSTAVSGGRGGKLVINGGKFAAKPTAGIDIEGYKFVEGTGADAGYWVLVPVNYVAQIGATKYETIEEAVAAANEAATEATITLLADCEIAKKDGTSYALVFSKNATITGAFTITGPSQQYGILVRDGATLTLAGGATITPEAGTSHTILNTGIHEGDELTWTTGNFVLAGGTIRGNGVNGNAIAAQAGTVTINSGSITNIGSRGVKAECIATAVINGGIIGDLNMNKPALYCANDGAITVNGGEINGTCNNGVTIPGTSTATFDRDQTTYCAAGYKTKIVSGDRYSVVPAVAVTITETKTTVSGVKVGDRFAVNEVISFTVAADPDTEIKTVTVNGTAATAGGAGAYTYTVTAADLTLGTLAIVATAESAQVGPSSDDGEITKPDPSTGRVVFTPTDPSATEATINLNGFGGGVEVPGTIATIKGVPEGQLKIQLNGYEVANKYFIGGDDKGFSTELSNEAKATLVTETEDVKPLVIGDNVDVTINTVAGLKYQLVRGTEVGTITTALGEPVVGNGQPLKLQDNAKPEGKAFYVIKTSK